MELTKRLRGLPKFEPQHVYTPEGEREYLTPIGRATGVTTILSGSKDSSGIQMWRESMGEARADMIRDVAAFRGSKHHANIEQYLIDGTLPKFDFLASPFWDSTWPFIQTIETPPLLQEGALWHELGYAGTCDCIAYLPGDDLQPHLIDWKTSTRPLNKVKLYDYYLQVAAYVQAANYVYAHLGLHITKAVIVCAVQAQQPSIHYVDENALTQYFKHFEARLKRYTFARSSRSGKHK